MDWSRAKNILIAMFLIINIFLSYQLYTISRSQYIYIEEEELESIKQHLTEKNIQLETEIPDRVLISPSIKVKYHEFDTKKVGEIFFKDADYELNNSIQGFVMKNGDISVEVKNGIYVTYRNQGIQIMQKDINEKKCMDNAYSFINQLQINSGNQFTKVKEIGKGYIRLVIGQEYSKISIDSSQVEIIATEEGVVSANINWLESVKPDKKYNIITPVMALLKAFENRGEKEDGVLIKEIRQGYYFAPNVTDDSNDKPMLEDSLSPMWVIVSDKTQVYINAYDEKYEMIK
ncbi:MAG: hypothetical protein K0R80_3548 [Clostridia bacterium]|nr:hypothetical protein [Clostridia bacterium]